MNSNFKKLSLVDRFILGIGYLLLGIFVLLIIVPLVYVVIASFMDPDVLNNKGISFNLNNWTLDAYKRVMSNTLIWKGFRNSFIYSVSATAVSMIITMLAAYPM